MPFAEDKKRVLAKLFSPDKSKKGDVDKEIIPLLTAINAIDVLYTTSSCSGRIVLLEEPASKKKHEARWLFVSHAVVDAQDLLNVELSIDEGSTLYLRQESAILHVACKDLDAAKKLLELCREEGLKHSGIVSFSKTGRIMVEMFFNERMDAPVKVGKDKLVDDTYVVRAVAIANEKLSTTHKKLAVLVRRFTTWKKQEQ
ncbi:MAG: hypothetical protein H6502_03875 [Candidatus Woesearchaeota archaeon]|nr:MAG: hypothetical protein H6502_03875 [Candidatus Woesearchaeota archaeon]